MKVLSIRQPWAWLIVNGFKDVENRTWATTHRGPTIIHAGKKWDHNGLLWVSENFPHIWMEDLPGSDEDMYERGGIVGMAELVDCVTDHKSPWFSGPHGFVFRNPHTLTFTPLPGQLGFFNANLTFTSPKGAALTL